MISDEYVEIGTEKKPLSKLAKIIIIASIISLILLVVLLIILLVFIFNPKSIKVSINRTIYSLSQWNFYPNLTRISTDITSIDFSKLLAETMPVTSPHTWNNYDGQNGDEYARYPCSYQQFIKFTDDQISGKNFYLEFCGSNLKTTVYIDGEKIGMHVGGYTKFRFDITSYVKTEFLLTVVVDNSNDREYYPMSADFTFFGGLYRNVNIIAVGNAHFSMKDYGTSSLYIKPNATTGEILINVSYSTDSSKIQPKIRYSIIDDTQDKIIVQKTTKKLSSGPNTHSLSDKIKNPHLWNGRDDPFLYRLRVDLIVDNTVVDRIESKFGFRTIEINTTGCFLNGRKYQLRGVSRHQDRLDKGWAISNEDEKEDLDLIYELGANVLRLAHYPQNATVYDYCDEKGIIVICEIPFISKFLDTDKSLDNLKIQLTEMIKQNFNHPSVALWGIMNELGQTEESDSMMKSIQTINDLAKSLDPSRMTYGAILQETLPSSRMVPIADVIGYNLYGGWYIGNPALNGHEIDKIRKIVPNKPLALTEYGAEGILKYHSDKPIKRDYSEEYQLQFHQKVFKIIEEKDLWGSFVWNMFDFASSTRNEGGVKGRNNKGLVTYDRKTKKDSFYLYKSFLNKNEKFVHICGHRFHDRATDEINLSVITSQPTFSYDLLIYVNNNKVACIEKNQNNMNTVNIALNEGMNYVRAVVLDPSSNAEIAIDQWEFEKVDVPNPDYIFYNESRYDDIYPHPSGYYSVLDSIEHIHKSDDAWKVFTDKFENKLDLNDLYPYLVEDRGIDFLTFGAGTLPQEQILEMNVKLNNISK